MPQLPTRPRVTRVRLVTLVAASALAVGGTAGLAVTPAHAASNSVVISAVYGGGGNSGAKFQNDYIELYNRGSSAIDLSGWTVTYYSSGGNSGGTTSLTGSVAPGAHFLVQEGAGTGSASPLPTPDASGTLNMSASKGSVVLRQNDTTIDTVGYGAVESSYVEGSSAPGMSNTTADSRTKGCFDTDDNAKDFVSAGPNPLNSAAPVGVCGTDGSTQPPPTGTPSTIEQIQGTSFKSPLTGEQVKDVRGVVTAVNGSAGFWIQSTTPDDDPRTSEGLYVYGGAGMVKVGDDLTVAGKVTEYRPGGVDNGNLTTTELGSPNIQVNSSGNELPTAVEIGSAGHVPPAQTVEKGDPGNVETAGLTLGPATNALDFWESMEGMRIQETDAKAVGPTETSYGETPIVPANTKDVTWTPDGGVLYRSYDTPNAMRLILSDALLPKDSIAPANTGDSYAGVTAGVLDYNFGNFTLMATRAGTHQSGGTTRDVAQPATKKQASVATFNVENLAPSDPQTKFDRLAGQITTNLAAPDVLAIEEIQDNTGATDDGTVDSTQTTDKLIAAIKAAGGPSYQAKWIDPVNDEDGGQPGGNIRSVFLYRTDRGMTFVDKPGGTSTNSVAVTGTGPWASVNYSPGRIDPTNTAWDDSRKPLVGEFLWQGKPLFVVANHFNSKGGDDGIMGRYQPPQRSSEVQRHAQATLVRGFVDELLTANKHANIVVLGDLNDFNFSKTANIVKGSGKTAMTDLIDTLPANERYSYDYQGNSQVLDQLLVSPALAKNYDYQVVHTNSQFYDQDSDHDPQVVKLAVH
ncbi:endonuclease [Flexivirga endophytica]|uniref:Endonuclease n=1 Tax=Flexivirga endophytica TaxID=1849103 RepID=A0A916WQM5_9MICO|nr:lamin tail domain-containing protein [Flexivirga endophytica]GGB21309.1 endonuclease [Flexivirga endophytica]GHB58995.1 endonuclease [Flexivirga endophytica]